MKNVYCVRCGVKVRVTHVEERLMINPQIGHTKCVGLKVECPGCDSKYRMVVDK